MKISRPWLQRYFDAPLPEAEALGEALTFHAFEIESIENDILDVKITANRGHDCLCHRGIAKELSAILNVPMKGDPLRQDVSLTPKTDAISLSLEDAVLSPRYVAGYLKNVNVGPSPDWLRKFLGSIGQKSINNIVDATNFVMFDLGQPLHAFDAGKLTQESGGYLIGVRRARAGERIVALDVKEYALTEHMLMIVDGASDASIGIAGLKGGKPASITEATHDIVIESANFNGVSVRKTAAALKLRTDASSRFEQVISPELAAYGMRAVVDLILEIAGGELVGFVDAYPQVQQQGTVTAKAARINDILGSSFSDDDVASVLTRLDLEFTKQEAEFIVEPPFERLDLSIPEDIAEEVGRIFGYDKIPAVELPALFAKPEVNTRFYAAERAREDLIAKGYSEVLTSVFSEKGERVVANKIDGVRPYLRATLIDGLGEALERNTRNKELLGLPDVRLFEIGAVWKDGKEMIMVGTADAAGVGERSLETAEDGPKAYDDLPLSGTERYRPFSRYPFIVRDISLWVPLGTTAEEVLSIIRAHAGALLVHSQKFDEFKKGEKQSFAFRLVFQSFDKTLTDFDANERMESVASALKAKGFEIR